MKNNDIMTCLRWTGNKTRFAPIINNYIPDDIEEYFEPFLGSGAVMIDLLANHVNENLKYVSASDTNPDLIAIWKLIKDNVDILVKGYTDYYNKYNKFGYFKKIRKSRAEQDENDTKILESRRAAYNAKRNEYNKVFYTGTQDAAIGLFCLMQTSFNNLIRYGKHGFNASAMPIKPGLSPDKIKTKLVEMSSLVNYYDVQFYCQSYDNVKLHTDNAVIYMDPPYELLAKNGLYNLTGFDFKKLSDYVKNTKYKKCIISFDGCNYGDKWFMLPELNCKKTSIDTGISTFIKQRHVFCENNTNIKQTKESLYLIDK